MMTRSIPGRSSPRAPLGEATNTLGPLPAPTTTPVLLVLLVLVLVLVLLLVLLPPLRDAAADRPATPCAASGALESSTAASRATASREHWRKS